MYYYRAEEWNRVAQEFLAADTECSSSNQYAIIAVAALQRNYGTVGIVFMLVMSHGHHQQQASSLSATCRNTTNVEIKF